MEASLCVRPATSHVRPMSRVRIMRGLEDIPTAGSPRGLVCAAEDLVSEQSLIQTTGMSNGCWFVGSVLTTETVTIEVETREGTQILPALPMTTDY